MLSFGDGDKVQKLRFALHVADPCSIPGTIENPLSTTEDPFPELYQ